MLTAENGSEALAISRGHTTEIHLVITDVVMPQMGGRAMIEQLANLRPGVRVLYMSGYTDNAIVHHGVLDANTNFIGKPFTETELLQRIRAVLGA